MTQKYDIVLIWDFGFVSSFWFMLFSVWYRSVWFKTFHENSVVMCSPSLMSSQEYTLPKEWLVTTHIHLYVFISSVQKKYLDKNNSLGDGLWEYAVLVPSVNCSAYQRVKVGTVCVQDVSCPQWCF